MKKEQIENYRPLPDDIVRYKDMGNIKEIMFAEHRNSNIAIKRLDKEYYVLLETGEVKKFEHIESRADDKNSVRVSLGKLRDIINTNVTVPENCRWCTLTYAENMTDTARLYDDFRKFIMRLKYNYPDNEFKYIVAMEPQGRGAWHAHLILIFETKAPFIPNERLAEIWGKGFVSIKAVKDIDNLGVYFSAYLADMEIKDIDEDVLYLKHRSDLKIVDSTDEDGKPVKKCIIKGARLKLYPPKFNIYRCSRGIKMPDVEYMRNSEAEKKVGSAKPTYERSIAITDNDFSNKFNYRQYNLNRHNNQE